MKTIGVFDSGVGGLSVLRALQHELPHTHWVYLSDSAFAPYGGRSREEVIGRSQRITAWLNGALPLDALVVACNTATAHAIDCLRDTYPALPIVGVEPALKTAARTTRTGCIGVLATSGTLTSSRFATLQSKVQAMAGGSGLTFVCQPCPGLADAIEQDDRAAIEQLCQRYVTALLNQIPAQKSMDSLVLGCTHYPFAMETLGQLCGPGVDVIDNAAPIARRTAGLVGAAHMAHLTRQSSYVSLCATGSVEPLKEACERWLPNLHQMAVSQISI